MTPKERVLAVLRGEVPDRIPFCPNIGQWFDCHKARGTLPPELRDCRDELDAMLALGCDIFSRRLCGGVRSTRNGYEVKHESLGNGWSRTEYLTPNGKL